jgi:glycosyltransferase involved in cell wall biosynthesis
VAEDAALYFNPRDPESAAEAILKLQVPNTRKELIRSGYAQLENFSWNDCLSKYVEIYNKLLAK